MGGRRSTHSATSIIDHSEILTLLKLLSTRNLWAFIDYTRWTERSVQPVILYMGMFYTVTSQRTELPVMPDAGQSTVNKALVGIDGQ